MFKLNLDPYKRYSLSSNEDINLQATYDQFIGIKPVGLWYAFGRSWIDLDQAIRGTDDIKLSPLFELQIDTSRFIKLTSADDIEQFNAKYGANEQIVNWQQVVKEFDGLEIVPFNPPCQLYWYKTFDIASGCIWNLNSIKKIIKINAKDYLDFGNGTDTNSLHQ